MHNFFFVSSQVFPCVTANCGQYYHPECVARLLSPDTVTKYEETIKSIANGNAFVCPLHICVSCRQGENKNVHDLQFAMCRRCPKAFHRKCLPKQAFLVFISFFFFYHLFLLTGIHFINIMCHLLAMLLYAWSYMFIHVSLSHVTFCREISFTGDYYEGIEQRAWDGLLDQRILMYCT